MDNTSLFRAIDRAKVVAKLECQSVCVVDMGDGYFTSVRLPLKSERIVGVVVMVVPNGEPHSDAQPVYMEVK